MISFASLLLALSLFFPVTAPAQDDLTPLPPPFCGALSAADCELLTASQELMRGVSSMQMALALDTSLTGIPDVADEELTFGMDMDMTLHLDPALSEALRVATTGSPEDLLANMDAFGARVVEFYEALGLDLAMEVALPGLLRAAIEADEGVTLPETIAMHVRMIDGYAYIDMDALAASFPDLRADLEAEGIDGWIGVDFAGQLARDMTGAAAAPDISTLQSLQISMAFNQMMQDETMRELLAPYITVERLADEERDGAPVALFRTTVELGDLVARRDFTQLLRRAAESMVAAAGETVDEQELGAGVLGVQLLANTLARAAEFELIQSVGLDAPYLYDNDLFMRLDLRGLLTLAAMSGEEIPQELRSARPIFTFDLNVDYSEFDAAPAVEVPDNVEILPLDSLDNDSMNVIS